MACAFILGTPRFNPPPQPDASCAVITFGHIFRSLELYVPGADDCSVGAATRGGGGGAVSGSVRFVPGTDSTRTDAA